MNVRNDVIINSPNNKNETCTEFVIDDITKPFMLNGTTEVGEDYTFSAWIKSSEESSINIYGESIPITNEWKRKRVTFNATGRGIRIYFDKVGTYYFYKSQLELGKVMSDASPSPEDIKASLEVKINRENLISEINASADVVRLTGDRLIIDSTNLQVTEDGTITAINGKFTGTIEATKGNIAGFSISKDGLVYGSVETGVFTQISGDEIRWIAGVEEEVLNEISGRVEVYRENRWFQFYSAYKANGEEKFTITPVGGFDPIGIFKGEGSLDWVISPPEYILRWDGNANFNKVKTTDLSSDKSIYLKCNGTTENTNNKYAIRFFKGDNDTAWFRPCADGLTNLGSSRYHWNNVYATNGTIQTSDRNKKKNIQYVDDKYIELFDLLVPKTFEMKDGKRTHVGFIAQEVEEAMKTLGLSNEEFAGLCIDRDEEGNTHYSLRYDELFMLCVAKLKQLERKILNEY